MERPRSSIHTGVVGWARVLPRARQITFLDPRLGLGLITTPLIWLNLSPLVAYNVAFLLSFWLSALGAYALGFTLTRSREAAFIGGLVFGFNPYRAGHLSHIELLSSYWLRSCCWRCIMGKLAEMALACAARRRVNHAGADIRVLLHVRGPAPGALAGLVPATWADDAALRGPRGRSRPAPGCRRANPDEDSARRTSGWDCSRDSGNRTVQRRCDRADHGAGTAGHLELSGGMAARRERDFHWRCRGNPDHRRAVGSADACG